MLDVPAWTILSAGAIDEFASPFVAIRATNLALVLLVTAIVAGAFLLVLWRSTRSLALLTAAADEVGRGNFEPRLPARSRDEVGRLTSAFELMTGRVREMITQLEASRQMAVVGEFAAQIAHEIRNPLTSIKLNLQTLDRAARQRGLQDEASRPLDISLREVQRLDRVVHGVLRLARSRSGERTLVSLRTVIERALEVTQPHILRNGITVELVLAAERCMVRADTAQLEGVFVNLFLNSAEAMPDGGTLRVALRSQQQSGSPSLRVRVEDTGPGVPVELSERIFQPFFTTRESGTGLGLALAQRTIEEHAGMLMLERKSPAHAGASGAVFVVDLPLAWEES